MSRRYHAFVVFVLVILASTTTFGFTPIVPKAMSIMWVTDIGDTRYFAVTYDDDVRPGGAEPVLQFLRSVASAEGLQVSEVSVQAKGHRADVQLRTSGNPRNVQLIQLKLMNELAGRLDFEAVFNIAPRASEVKRISDAVVELLCREYKTGIVMSSAVIDGNNVNFQFVLNGKDARYIKG